MKPCDCIICNNFPCNDINTAAYTVPYIEVDPHKIQLVTISEAPPAEHSDYFYAPGNPFYLETTMQAFNYAGKIITSLKEIIDSGIYITTAIKCAKTHYSISSDTVQTCSVLLENEIALFPDIKAFLLMGDTAIKAMNSVWKKNTGTRVIPAGSTYKIRKQQFFFENKRVFPSYLQTGGNYLIEKSKRKMIADDIREALNLIEL